MKGTGVHALGNKVSSNLEEAFMWLEVSVLTDSRLLPQGSVSKSRRPTLEGSAAIPPAPFRVREMHRQMVANQITTWQVHISCVPIQGLHPTYFTGWVC